MLLILCDYSLKVSKTPVNPSTPGDNKRLYMLKQNLQLRASGFFLSMYVFLLPPALEG